MPVLRERVKSGRRVVGLDPRRLEAVRKRE